MGFHALEWAQRFALTVNHVPSLNHARDKLLTDVAEHVDTYTKVHDDPEYSKIFADTIREHCEALQLVGLGLIKRKYNQIKERSLIDVLGDCEQLLADMISDEMTKCDERGERTPGHAFTVAEEAAPELDHARTLIQEAVEELEEWEKNNGAT